MASDSLLFLKALVFFAVMGSEHVIRFQHSNMKGLSLLSLLYRAVVCMMCWEKEEFSESIGTHQIQLKKVISINTSLRFNNNTCSYGNGTRSHQLSTMLFHKYNI